MSEKMDRPPLETEKDVAAAVAQLKSPDLPEGPTNPKLKKTKYTVSGAQRLYLIVTDKGAKYWNFRYRFDGKEKEAYVGKPFPQTSLKEAKKKAAILNARILNGEDPSADKANKKHEKHLAAGNTFEKAANAWHEHRANRWSPLTSKQVREYLDKDMIPEFSGRKLDSIRTVEMADLLQKVVNRGAPDVAKKIQQWLGKIYTYARAHGWATIDPVRDLREIAPHVPQGQSYAHLPEEELPPFLRKLRVIKGDPSVKGALWMILWSACRPGVTRTLLWSEIDLDRALWTIVKGRDGMKLRYAHYVPLPRQAVEMLKEHHRITGKFEHVFLGRNDPDKSISDNAVNGLIKRLGYRGKQTGYGVRHVVSTALNKRNYSPDWIERQLSHGDPDKVRATYNKTHWLDDRRVMMQKWADELDEMMHSEI
jgi:integrase